MKPRTTTATFDDEVVTLFRDPLSGRLLRTHIQRTRPDDMDIASRIIRFVAARYGLTPADLESHRRPWSIVWPRWLAMSLIHQHTRFSLIQVGLLFDRDHTSIMHAINGIEKELQSNCARGREVTALFQTVQRMLTRTKTEFHFSVADSAIATRNSQL